MKLERISRWWNKRKAQLGGYFWKSCPKCGRMFGGHEAKKALAKGVAGHVHEDSSFSPDGRSHSWITCPRCPGCWEKTPEGLLELKEGIP